MSDAPRLFVATKAFIIHNGRVLVVREKKYADGTREGFFGIPGGRMEPGEQVHEALKREAREEIGLEVEIGEPLFVQEWRPVVRGEQWHIVAIFFECTADSYDITLGEEHDAHEWIDPAKYKEYKLMDNEYPVYEAYIKRHKLTS